MKSWCACVDSSSATSFFLTAERRHRLISYPGSHLALIFKSLYFRSIDSKIRSGYTGIDCLERTSNGVAFLNDSCISYNRWSLFLIFIICPTPSLTSASVCGTICTFAYFIYLLSIHTTTTTMYDLEISQSKGKTPAQNPHPDDQWSPTKPQK